MEPAHLRRAAALACTLALAVAPPLVGAAEDGATGTYEVCLDVTADVRALGSDDAFVWEPASERLAALGPAAWPALLRALDREGPAVREAIVGVLASGPDADEGVRERLGRVARKDPEPEVRGVAVQAVRKLAGAASRDVVVAALDDPVPAVRRKAITACTGLCTDDAALARLVALALGDEPLSNALQARRVLWSLTADGGNAAVVAQVRAATIAAAPVEGTERRTLLAALLLAELGDDARLDDVARATHADQPVELRLHAVHALGRIGGADRVALLDALLQDPAVAIHAHDALRRMSARGVATAGEAADRHTGPRAPQPLPRP